MSAWRKRFYGMLRRQRLTPTAPVQLGRRHLYILPTRYGWLFALLLILMLIASLNYDNNPAYLLTFLLVGLGVNAMYFTWRNLHGLQLRLQAPAPVFAGEPAELQLQTAAGARAAVAFSLGGDVRLDDLDPEGAAVTLRVPTQKRGWLQPGDLEITSCYPLGLFRVWSIVHIGKAVLVYPRPAREAVLPTRMEKQSDRENRRIPGQDDFHGLREFRAGDPLSYVDWKGLARERGMLSKQFDNPVEEAPVTIDWELFSPADTETRLAIMTRLVIDASEAGRYFGLVLPGSRLEPARGTRHLHTCLRKLALFGDKSDEPV